MIMSKQDLKERVMKGLDEIRPFLQRDGGDIQLVDIENSSLVKVRLQGNCIGCSVNQLTLKSGVEMTIKKHAPEIQKVIDVSGELNRSVETDTV